MCQELCWGLGARFIQVIGMGPTTKLITAQEHGGLVKRRFVVSARDQHTQSALEHGGGNLTQMVNPEGCQSCL